MWSEAMRVCREYLPSQEAALRRELGQKTSQIDGGNNIEEARRWLEVGEIRAALDILLLDPQASRAALVQAAEILLHQAEPDVAAHVGGDLGARLFTVGEHALAAQVNINQSKLQIQIKKQKYLTSTNFPGISSSRQAKGRDKFTCSYR